MCLEVVFLWDEWNVFKKLSTLDALSQIRPQVCLIGPEVLLVGSFEECETSFKEPKQEPEESKERNKFDEPKESKE